MSLDNIQITPELIKDLYSKSLVDLEIPVVKDNSKAKTDLPFLGKNEKNILLVVNEEGAVFLPDEDLNFLVGIMSACRLTIADIALVNFHKNKEARYNELVSRFAPSKILFFGIEPSVMDFPLQFPHYQLQKYNHQNYLSAPALNVLSKYVSQKKQLWACLKILFEIE